MYSKESGNVLKGFEGKFVEVMVIGAIKIPYYFEKFEVSESSKILSFGHCDSENYTFNLWKYTLEVVEIDDDCIKLKIEDDGFTTYLAITKLSDNLI